ncbi:conserved hypothetical protein [uncultured Eubacteriales bacterium]|uniref:Portal protein n=1 Tax=uncultured Eubacteriales bacterium TaxID=172733 RepID=A0A212JSS0_9FIRM|nr:conserved hypothetical protein [uncultured Eubacteriales bacterium]
MTQENQTPNKVWVEYDKGVNFKNQIELYETVKNNENFFIGKQWEGVQSNGLPTPVFNFIKRIVLFLVASTATDNIKMAASPLSSTGFSSNDVERLCAVVNAQFDALFEQNKVGKLMREFMRNSAVDGDGCLYSWFDTSVETGQTAKGNIRVELLENTRVIFGNPNSREVQTQPYIIVPRRELVSEVKLDAEANGESPDAIRADTDEVGDRFDAMTDDKVTTITKFWREKETGTIWCIKTTKDSTVRRPWDTGQKLYPIVWMNWDFVQNCYHGQAAVTGLIPNQVFVNKLFAMTMISLMTTAYPKVVYDKTRVAKWDSRVGAAIGVNGGDVSNVAKTIDPATISPQVSQFIQMAINLTKEFMGATDAALGDTRPDNTSAIIALQKASSVPMELTKQNLFQSVEDMGNIWLDLMRVYYGERSVEMKDMGNSTLQDITGQMSTMEQQSGPVPFDFSVLEEVPLSLKLDVGGSAYWSEIAQMNTLDNLLMQGKIDVVDYLERVPSGYISNKQELIKTIKERQMAAMTAKTPTGGANAPIADFNQPVEVPVGGGYGELQRKLNTTGAEGLNLTGR